MGGLDTLREKGHVGCAVPGTRSARLPIWVPGPCYVGSDLLSVLCGGVQCDQVSMTVMRTGVAWCCLLIVVRVFLFSRFLFSLEREERASRDTDHSQERRA